MPRELRVIDLAAEGENRILLQVALRALRFH